MALYDERMLSGGMTVQWKAKDVRGLLEVNIELERV